MPKYDVPDYHPNLLSHSNTPSYYYNPDTLGPPAYQKPKAKSKSKSASRDIDESGVTKEGKHKSKHKSKEKVEGESSSSNKDKKRKKKEKKKRRESSSSSGGDSDGESTFSMQSISSTLGGLASSHRAQLAATALVSGLIVGGGILTYQATERRSRTQKLKESIHLSDEESDGDMERSIDLSNWRAHSTNSSFAARDTPPAYSSAVSSSTGPDRQISDEESTALAKRAQSLASQKKPIPEELILEQLSRNHSFLGSEGMRTIRSSFIVIVGLGGVGSWCTTMLVRSGVGRVRLVDFDQVTLSSLNRHAVATLEDVGTPKVLAMKKRLEAVAPWVEIETCNELWTMKDAKRLLDGEPDWVVDAIDNVDHKVDLLAYCHEQKIPVISSMGAGCKSDPTRLCVGDISETTEDPLSKATRRLLRQRGIANGITVVYSTEKPGPGKAQLLPLADEEHAKGNVEELGVLENFRVRILPVLGTMPATFGLTVANHILVKLAKYPLEYLPANTRFRPQFYGQVVNQLLAVESRMRNNIPGLKVPVSETDAGYLLEEVFAGRSVVSGLTNRLQLVRWYPLIGGRYEEGSTGTENDGGKLTEQEAKKMMETIGVGAGGAVRMKLEDLVVMTKEEVKEHEKKVLIGGEHPEEVWGKEVQKLVEKKWAEEKAFRSFRD